MPLIPSEPRRPFASCHEHPNRRTCMLMVTHGCNLNCTYCYEKFKNGAKRMEVSLAKEIIAKEIAFVKGDERFEELEIDFMGGEPLLRFDLIKEVVEWLVAGNCDIPFICFATTNGTLLNEENKQWLRQYKEVMVLGASYDGLGEAQSTNRGEAATHVDFDFFQELWPEQGFKMTLSKASLPLLYESLVDAAKRGMRVDASLAHGEDWNLDDARVFHEQLDKLREFYLENPEYEPTSLLSRTLFGVGDKSGYQARFCGSGVHMATYDVDGTLYGCHMFTPLVLNERAMKHADFDGWDNDQRLTDPACEGCGFLKWCPTCMGFNMLDRGDVSLRDHRWCVMTAVQALCACQFQIQYFPLHMQEENMREDEAQALQSALEAYEYLSTIDITKPFPQ